MRAEAVEFAANGGGAMRCFEVLDAEQRKVSAFFAFSGEANVIRFGVFDRASK